MKKYITTPIYYVNDVPHIGHAYTTIICDCLARFYRLVGYDTFFMTGTDEHGQKIEEAALKRGKTPKEYADEVSLKFKELWDYFDISYDHFIRTTDDYHIKNVAEAFEIMQKEGDIYKGDYEGFYCVSCESFFTQTQLINEDCCPDCGKKTKLVKEESYFFRLSKYENDLLKWYENEDCVIPKGKKNEVISFVKSGLKDLSITRTSFDWGIKIPSDKKHVVYVWLDALLNYVSTLKKCKGENWLEFWSDANHVVGKDILRFHAIYWPAFLMSLNLPLPQKIAAHGWWTRDGRKMSKSIGNVVNPKEAADAYGLEQFRYFLLREVPFGQDGDFSQKAMINRINSELANNLGNLLSRTIGMSKKYFYNKISSKNLKSFYKKELEEAEILFKNSIQNLTEFSTNRYLEDIFKALDIANNAVATYEPWNLMKNFKNDEAMSIVSLCANILAKAAILLSPAMPKTADKIAKVLNFEISTKNYEKFIKNGEILDDFVANSCEPLFTKVENELMITPTILDSTNQNTKGEIAQIKIDDFKKNVIKVGTILSCEKIKGSDKLLEFKIDFGEEKPRNIVSGIAKFYVPKDLIGVQVCALTNLKPAKVFGHLSEGMILTADDGNLSLISPKNSVKNGVIIG